MNLADQVHISVALAFELANPKEKGNRAMKYLARENQGEGYVRMAAIRQAAHIPWERDSSRQAGCVARLHP